MNELNITNKPKKTTNFNFGVYSEQQTKGYALCFVEPIPEITENNHILGVSYNEQFRLLNIETNNTILFFYIPDILVNKKTLTESPFIIEYYKNDVSKQNAHQKKEQAIAQVKIEKNINLNIQWAD